MDQTLMMQLNQAAINGIRAAGATTEYITPEGNSWTGAWTWITSGNGDTMGALMDPSDKLIYQMHQCLDSDGGGSHKDCVSATIMSERLVKATNWLRTNNKLGLLGGYAAGNGTTCVEALQDGLAYFDANSDVWTGGLWWAAGPWWGDYIVWNRRVARRIRLYCCRSVLTCRWEREFSYVRWVGGRFGKLYSSFHTAVYYLCTATARWATGIRLTASLPTPSTDTHPR